MRYIYLETPVCLENCNIYGHEVITEEEFKRRQNIFNYIKEKYPSYTLYIELPDDSFTVVTLSDIKQSLDDYATLTNEEYLTISEFSGDVFGFPFWEILEDDLYNMSL